MEYLDLYDKNKINTHKKIVRGEKIPKELYRYVVHTCIFNSKGEMLIQKRADSKKFWPSLWDVTAGGCVSSGETPAEGMTRELKEELDVDYDYTVNPPAFTFTFSDGEYDNGYDDWYLVCKDVDISKCKLQLSEVSEIKYVTKQELKKMNENGECIKYQDYFFDFIFEMAKQTNIFKE